MPAVDLPHHESWHPLTPHEASSKPLDQPLMRHELPGE
jgi:hypothetical protein